MSSIFGHHLAAVYQDRAYAFRPKASWLAIGAAFAVGALAAIAVMKVPAGSSDPPVKAGTAQSASKQAPPAPAQIAAGKPEVAAKPPIRVIAPDVVPPPPNVTAAATRDPPREHPQAVVADPNTGIAPRDQMADMQRTDAVPLPPPKPARMRVAAAPDAAPTAVAEPPPAAPVAPAAAAPVPPAPTVAERAAQESTAKPAEPAAKPMRKDGKAARREARRMQRDERRHAYERSRALQERNEAEGFSLVDAYRTRDGRRVTVYRRYNEEPGRSAMAYGDDHRSGRRGFFGLFDFD